MLFFTVLLIEILACAEVDIFVPSFPMLQELFLLTPFDVELTMSVNLVAYCLTALAVGTMGDRYGRKPLILVGLGIFLGGTLLCIFAPNFFTLLVGRAFQGMGMAGPATLGYVVIADHYSVSEQQKRMGVLNGIVSLSMAAAPVAGSYITLFWGWKGNFVALLLLGFGAFFLSYGYIPYGSGNKEVSVSLSQYVPILESKEVMLFMAVICLAVLVFWVFVGISPILYMEDLGVPLKQFGLYQGALAGSFALISFSSPWFLKHFGQKKCFYGSYIFLSVFFVCCLFLFLFNIKNPLMITAVMMIMSMALVMPVNILWPMALEVLPQAKGRVSGIFVAFRMILTALGLQIVSYFYSHDVRSIAFFMVLMMIATFSSTYFLTKLRPLFPDET
jgi:DHA1 family bicyclomycin/chloramphenicol resistance-like MFS transporter